MMLPVLASIALHLGCAAPVLWRHPGSTIVRDETSRAFELVQRYGPADKSAEWGPVESIVRRIDGKSGRVVSENRTWGRPNPQPDFVFGWNGDFVLYDHDRAIFLRANDVLNGSQDRQITIANGARVALLNYYPRPMVGPRTGNGTFKVWSIDLQNMVAQPIEISNAAGEIAVCNDLLIVQGSNSLTAYSLDGARVWQDTTVGNERLSVFDIGSSTRYGAGPRFQSPFLATTIGSHTSTNSIVVLRRADSGRVEWRKDIESVTPSVAMALGPYIVFIGKREYESVVQGQRTSAYEARWWVWDGAGNEIAKGIEPAWKPEYAFRGGAAATSMNVAFDAPRNTIVVGCGLDAALIRDGKVVRRLTDVPGEPLILDDNVLVCRGESSHFAIRLDSVP